jgi:hypothetical protein
MAQYPLFYFNGTRYLHVQGMLYDTASKKVVPAAAIAPKPPQPPTTTPTSTRSFDLPLGKVSGKKPFGFRDGDMIVRGDGYVTFNKDHIVLSGAAPRLYVYDEKRTKKWKNVEVIVEYMRVSENSPPSHAGLGIGVRSIHELGGTNGPTYYAKHTFDSRIFFEKEQVHGQSYTKVSSMQNRDYPMERNVWYRMTFKVVGIKLEVWVQKDGESLRVYRNYTDAGAWNNKPAIVEGTSCFIRNDSVKDFRVRKFSIKEIPA